jgi:hypothetical protein
MKGCEPMVKKGLSIILIFCIIFSLSGCKYNFPENSKTEPHTYDEALTYIQDYLNRDDVTLSQNIISGESEYGAQYTNYFAQVDDIRFIVSSQERCHYDQTGEFCKFRFNLYNNYNYEMIYNLIEKNENYPDFVLNLQSKPYLNQYNIATFNYLPVITDESSLIVAFNKSKEMYEWMIEFYPSPRYYVSLEVADSEKTLYLSAHKTDNYDIDYGFDQAALNALIDDYRRLD